MLQAQLPRAPSAGTLELNTRSSPFPVGLTSGPSDVESHLRGVRPLRLLPPWETAKGPAGTKAKLEREKERPI